MKNEIITDTSKKVIENIESDLNSNIKNLGKRVSDNDEDIQNVEEKIKLFEDKIIPEQLDQTKKISKHEDEIKIIKQKYEEWDKSRQNMKNEIIMDTSKKVIENIESDLKTDVKNFVKRVSDNDEDLQNVAKKIKLIEDTVISEQIDQTNKISKHEDDIKIIKEKYEDLDKSREETSKNLKDEVTKNMILKFQEFTNKLNDRVLEEVENVKKVHDRMNKNVERVDRSLRHHVLVHKNDRDTVVEMEKQVNELDQIVKKVNFENEVKLLWEKIRSIETESNNTELNNNVTKNMEKIEEVFKQLTDLESKYKINVDDILLKDIEKLKLDKNKLVEFKQKINDLEQKVKEANFSRDIEILREKIQSLEESSNNQKFDIGKKIEEIMIQINNLESKYKTDVNDKLLKDMQKLKMDNIIGVELVQKMKDLEQKVKDANFSKDIELLREKIKNIEESPNNEQIDNITKNSGKIEEISKQLNDLETKYKTNFDDKLLKQIRKLKTYIKNVDELEKNVMELEKKVEKANFTKELELLRDKIKSIEDSLNNQQIDNITKNSEKIEEILKQLNDVETKYETKVDDKLLEQIENLKTKSKNFGDLEKKVNQLEKEVKDTNFTKELKLLGEKIKSIEDSKNNQPIDNITKNTEKIEEILKQLNDLETKYKTNIDDKLSEQIENLKTSSKNFVDLEKKVKELETKVKSVNFNREIELLREKIRSDKQFDNVTKNSEKIEEILKQLNDLETKCKTNIDDKLLEQIENLKTKSKNFVDLEKKVNELEKEVKDANFTKELELLRDKIKSIEDSSKNQQTENITKNSEKIEEILKQLNDLETKYKTSIDNKLSEQLENLKTKSKNFVDLEKKVKELEEKVKGANFSKELELLREKVRNSKQFDNVTKNSQNIEDILKELSKLQEEYKNNVENKFKQLDNITKNTEKIEEILTQLHNLESEYKTIIDGDLLKEIKKLKKVDVKTIVDLLEKLGHVEDDLRQTLVDIVLKGLEVSNNKIKEMEKKLSIFQETNKEQIGVLRLISNEREIKVGRNSALLKQLEENVDKLIKNQETNKKN